MSGKKESSKKTIFLVLFFSLGLLLPFITGTILLLVWKKQIPENVELFDIPAQYLIGCFFATLTYSLILIYSLFREMTKIYTALDKVVPFYKLQSFYNSKHKKTFFIPMCSEIVERINCLGKYIRQLSVEKISLEETKMSVELDSIYDSLCQVFNRMHTERLLDERLKEASPELGVGVAMLDLDFFKNVNDTYGHDCGDFVLKEISGLVYSVLREHDVIGRWGGEEFLVIVRAQTNDVALKVVDRVRRAVEDKTLFYIDKNGHSETLHCTVSIGVTFYDGTKKVSFEKTVKRADQALYQSKEGGRNRVTYLEL